MRNEDVNVVRRIEIWYESTMILLYVPFDHLLDKNNGLNKVYYPRNLVHRRPRMRRRHVRLGAQLSGNYWNRRNRTMRDRIETIKLVKVVSDIKIRHSTFKPEVMRWIKDTLSGPVLCKRTYRKRYLMFMNGVRREQITGIMHKDAPRNLCCCWAWQLSSFNTFDALKALSSQTVPGHTRCRICIPGGSKNCWRTLCRNCLIGWRFVPSLLFPCQPLALVACCAAAACLGA